MSRFYLNEYRSCDGTAEWRIPAAGIAYYEEAPGNAGTFDEFIIDASGLPVRNGTVSIPFPAGITQHTFKPDAHQVPLNDWLDATTGGGQRAFLAFRRFDANNPPNAIWDNALIPLAPQSNGEPAFKIHRRVLLTMILQLACDRRQIGYVTAFERLSVVGAGLGMLSNAEPFLVALQNVSNRIIETVQLSLSRPDEPCFDPSRPRRGLEFNFPEWVFLLNRTVAEGFIEGCAQRQLTDSKGFDVHADNKRAWKTVIERVEAGWDMAQLRAGLPGTKDEVDSIENLGRYLRDIVQAKFIPEQTYIDFVLHTVTPGSVPKQVFAWWYLHYPHWHRDMAFALHRYASPLIMNYAGNTDWNTLSQIIMQSFPTRGTGLDLADMLQAWLLQIIGGVTGFPSAISRMVEAVFGNIEAQVQRELTPP